jgi:hypothetical protein
MGDEQRLEAKIDAIAKDLKGVETQLASIAATVRHDAERDRAEIGALFSRTSKHIERITKLEIDITALKVRGAMRDGLMTAIGGVVGGCMVVLFNWLLRGA